MVIKLKKKILLLGLLVFMICGCSRNNEKPKENPIVTMSIKDFGDIKIELYPDVAENTVANFVNLVEDKFYNNNSRWRSYRYRNWWTWLLY